MPKPIYVQPVVNAERFTCPVCHTGAQQDWNWAQITIPDPRNSLGRIQSDNLRVALCAICRKNSIWLDGKMIFPETIAVDDPNEDLNKDIQEDYREAAKILSKSPRGSAALLRLCVQKLCKQLGEPGKNINTDIKSLVARGLPIHLQQALDTVRVVGNEAVHPGTIDLNDTPEVAQTLFELVNMIADILISQPIRVGKLYSKLPATKREEIEKRDNLHPIT